MKRIKTNIIHLSNLFKTPCKKWLKRFQDEQLDADEAFRRWGERYDWLYEYSNYDLIRWQIEHGTFDWARHSWAVARYCPDLVDPERYNWKDYSWAIMKYCPRHFDAERYNWKDCSWDVANFCPECLDPERYNWERDSWAVERYCPEKLSLQPKK